MLRSLRDKTNEIPAVQQLNNFLKSLRNKRDDIGVTGSRMCLNDFYIFKKNLEIYLKIQIVCLFQIAFVKQPRLMVK